MEESKKGYFPMLHGIHLSKGMCFMTKKEKMRMNKIPYALTIGSIMYAMCTRLYVSYTLSFTSKYQVDLGEGHQTAVKNILKYMKRTKDVFLVYRWIELQVKDYIHASFQIEKDDSKSQIGYIFTLNNNAVCWKSSKQNTIADSTTEAEYISASEAGNEGLIY